MTAGPKRPSPLRRSTSPTTSSPTGESLQPADTGFDADPIMEEAPESESLFVLDESTKQTEPAAGERELQRKYGSVFRMSRKLLDRGGQQYFDSADWAKDKAMGLPSDRVEAKPKPKPRARAPSEGLSELMPPPKPSREACC